MKRTIHFLLLWLFISSSNFEAQTSPDIGGEIETQLRMNLENVDDMKSDTIWTRATFRLKLESEIGSNAHAFAGLKIHTTEIVEHRLQLKEAYVDYYGSDYDLRGGLQVLSWGTAYKINPTDVINPYDLTEEAVFIPEDKLGVIAARINYYPTVNLILTGVYIPYFVPAFQPSGVTLPERTVENSEYALKLTAQSIMGYDLSVSYFRGKEDYPWINEKYRNVEIYGGDVIGTIWEVALWAEGAYTQPEGGDSSYELAVGGEYTFWNDLYFMSQLYHRSYPENKENYLMAVLRHPFRDIHTFQLGLAYKTENEIFIAFPEITLSLADATSLKIGAIYINEQVASSLLSQIKNMALIELEYYF
ncbi:hypothetical protein KAW96_09095 [candidate division WOR-3 bacterium]|nr:hypothetical protein [candidate division WOR-3 bacterium]